jgi:hypothetical protein
MPSGANALASEAASGGGGPAGAVRYPSPQAAEASNSIEPKKTQSFLIFI